MISHNQAFSCASKAKVLLNQHECTNGFGAADLYGRETVLQPSEEMPWQSLEVSSNITSIVNNQDLNYKYRTRVIYNWGPSL
jgi:hypothetical protein